MGRRFIRGECSCCHRSVGILPQVSPYVEQADARASPAPILDALTRLEELGIELESDGRQILLGDNYHRLPPELRALVKQCNHTLARLLGDTRRRVS